MSSARTTSDLDSQSVALEEYGGIVPGEFYFMALGGLGVSLAGFAGLIAALDHRRASHSPVAAWRIRNIVILSFAVTFVGFNTVALYTVTRGDLALTVSIASATVMLPEAWWLWFESRPGPAWPSEGQRRGAQLSAATIALLALGNVFYGGLGVLQILMLFLLSNPVSIFFSAVRDITRHQGRSRAEADEKTGDHDAGDRA